MTLPRVTRVKSDVRYLEFFPATESFWEYWVCFTFCAILCARGRVVSDDWQLPDRFESELLSRNARFLAVDSHLRVRLRNLALKVRQARPMKSTRFRMPRMLRPRSLGILNRVDFTDSLSNYYLLQYYY